MSKVILGLLISLFLMSANAQAHCGKCGIGDSPKEDMSSMVSSKVEKLTKELSLTDEQKGTVEGLIKEKMEKRHQIMEEKHKAMDALHEDFETKVNGVLTAEQKTKWETLKKDDHGAMGCPDCKDGKMCKKCMLKKGHKKMAGHCPDCKDGKMCKKCMLKKVKEEQDDKE